MKYQVNALKVSQGKHTLLAIDALQLTGPGLVVIHGPSGAGKSTLLMALAGLIPNYSGQIYLQDTLITNKTGNRLRQHCIGYLFQNFELIGALSALDNVLLRADAMQINADANRARSLLTQFGITEVNKPARRFSRGQQQRIALARALYGEPEVLLCDEPTASLDAANAHEVASALVQQAESKLVIVSTHDQNLLALASSSIHLAFGRLEQSACAA
ncbi:ABC transporter ATP-binding protein [Salinibius halmophilus]|uniref:ABC transporter ATP-binding protein n=1 Tax=Salinibius halmophilus TaxID=1853216 RepID=UPI000E65F7C0|nr:ATP-binding cassette domain-containing protein [Salinibius halmophilus]